MELTARFREYTEGVGLVGFQIESKIVGILIVNPNVSVGDVQTSAQINGVILLYGTLRGILATASAVFPHGPFLSPAVSPRELLNLEGRQPEKKLPDRKKPEPRKRKG